MKVAIKKPERERHRERERERERTTKQGKEKKKKELDKKKEKDSYVGCEVDKCIGERRRLIRRREFYMNKA